MGGTFTRSRSAGLELSPAADKAADGLMAAVRVGAGRRDRNGARGRGSRRPGAVNGKGLPGDESARDRVARYAIFLLTATATGVVGFAVSEALTWM